MEDSWNHNAHYYNEIVATIPGPHRSVLDVGCGDGQLIDRIAPLAHMTVGIDPDAKAIAKARKRLDGAPNVQLISGDFLTTSELDGRQFDAIACVAALHHMHLAPALECMRDLLTVGGRLHVIGLAANETIAEKAFGAVQLLPARIGSILHRERPQPHMIIKDPDESLAEIRQTAAAVLPGTKFRQRLYYRYSLTWTKD